MKTRLATVLVPSVLALALSGCAVEQPGAPASPSAAGRRTPDVTQSGSVTGATVTCEYKASGTAPAKPVDPPQGNAPASGTVTLTLALKDGPIVMTLDRAKAPCAVNSLESLAKQGYLDGTTCHRLVDHGLFVLQCGDPSGTGTGGPGYAFADELTGKETYDAGTVAMANTGAHTNGSQFFLVYQDSPLPPKYTVFGSIDDASIGVITRLAEKGQDGAFGDSGHPIGDARITKATLG